MHAITNLADWRRANLAVPDCIPCELLRTGCTKHRMAGLVRLLDGARAPPPGVPTFRELAEEWLATEGSRRVEPENERRHVRHLEPLRNLTEGELRPGIVKQVLASLLRPNGPLGPATVNAVHSTEAPSGAPAAEGDAPDAVPRGVLRPLETPGAGGPERAGRAAPFAIAAAPP